MKVYRGFVMNQVAHMLLFDIKTDVSINLYVNIWKFSLDQASITLLAGEKRLCSSYWKRWLDQCCCRLNHSHCSQIKIFHVNRWVITDLRPGLIHTVNERTVTHLLFLYTVMNRLLCWSLTSNCISSTWCPSTHLNLCMSMLGLGNNRLCSQRTDLWKQSLCSWALRFFYSAF